VTSLTGKVAFVTGGSAGIGLAIARALAVEGLHVAITGRDEARLDAARTMLSGAGGPGVEAIRADVRRLDEVDAAIATTVSRFGGLDVVVNNAGIGGYADVATMTPAQWAATIDTNLTGVYNTCHVAIPHLRLRGSGFIINISSLAGKNAFPGGAAYCASKAGLNAFSEALMQELRYDDIRVSYIMPGSVDTGFSGRGGDQPSDWKIPPGDIGDMVVHLLRSETRTLSSRVEMRPSRPPRR
jgi:3-oxoacyl-[acyl-carrier protein] reductase